MPNRTSSGDLLADKRFAYAEALAAEGDPEGAAELYAQAAELAPGWAPVYIALGLTLERLGDIGKAKAALAVADRLDPEGAFGASLHRARLAGKDVEALPLPYVAALFDQYADRFDAHLTGPLAYRGPEVILQGLDRSGTGVPAGPVLDLGCGTGLMGRALGPRDTPADGIDLSPAMVAAARETGFYGTLIVGDAVATLGTLPPGVYHAVFAADVLVYMGDLRPVAAAVARVLAPRGLFAGTVQAGRSDGVALGPDLRFHHGADHVQAALRGAGLDILAIDPCTTRREAGRDVPGLVFVARSP